MLRIDINCDMGESFGAYQLGHDEEMLDIVTSVNVACGFHAGDPSTMKSTVRLALERSVAVGAHPGYPDLVGFGRRKINVSPTDLHDMVVYQVGALNAFVCAQGGTMQHVKPHGAMYNMAAVDNELAEAIAEAVYDVNVELILYGLSGSRLIAAGKRIGLRTASEVFADRTYESDGTLTSRNVTGAVITDTEKAVSQAVRMIHEGKVHTRQGTDVTIQAQTVCVHGDGAKALDFARALRTTLDAEGVTILPLKA